MKLGIEAKRAAIYFFYDKDGIVDDYIIHQLKDLKENVLYLLVVVNGALAFEGEKKLSLAADGMLIRENRGFDVWAYKEGIKYIGWDNLAGYDELLLMNFTMFGPLYPLKAVFEEMNGRDVDFWGLTKHHKVDFNAFGNNYKYNYIPEHIQSSFLVIRNSLLTSRDYMDFWKNMPMVKSYADSVGYYESVFTQDFKDMGYHEDVFVNTEDLREYTRYPLLFMAYELVKNRKCPFVKRKSFCQNYNDLLGETLGRPSLELFDYIKNNTGYDVNLIWDNILRLEHMYDIKNILHLNYILPYDAVKNNKTKKNIALIFHLHFLDLLENSFGYIDKTPSYAHVYITTDTKEKKVRIEERLKRSAFQKKTVILVENRGRDVSALLIGGRYFVMDYDYVCFAHDKKTTQVKPLLVGESFAYKCLENVLGSENFIENIVQTFSENPRLGLLTPPPPNHGGYFSTFHSVWYNNYENTLKLAGRLGLRAPMHWSKEPIAPCGTMFWFRPKALERLFKEDWKYDDFPEEPNEYDGTFLHAVERVYPFAAQNAGYYSAWVMSDRYSRIEMTNLNYFLHIHTPLHETPRRQLWNGIKVKLKKIIPPSLWKVMSAAYRKIFGKD
jgi:rhamnosyltransferase